MGAIVWALLLVTWFNLTFAFSQIRHSNATPSVGKLIKDIKSADRVDNIGGRETGADNTANDTSSSSSALWRHQRRNTRRLPTSSSSTMMSHVTMYSSNVGDEPQFSSSQNRHIYQHGSPLGLPQHLQAEATSHGGSSYGGQGQSQRKCQVMQKPMPTFDNYNGVQQKMMTCYVCGDQSGGYGGYTEDCQYKPTQDSTQNYGQTTTRHYNSVPYKGSSNGPHVRENNRGHEPHSYEEVSPQATDGKNSYNGGQSGGVRCKIVQKGHMKCRVCGDSKSDAVFSEQCGFESNNPGQHGQRSYDFSAANENTYRSPHVGHTPDFGGHGSSGYGRPSYSDNFNSYTGPYDDHSSYAPSRNYHEAHQSSSTGNKDVKVSPSEGRNKNCKTIYKHMDSHYPYSKASGDRPKMKCEVCVKSDGYGGVTEECNYSDGGESTGSYPGPFDHSSFYGPDQDHFYSGVHDDIYGDYFFK